MEKPVIISIRGTQSVLMEDEDTMEFITQGTLAGGPGDYRLSYQESELTGMEGTTTTFLVGDDQIILKREGTLQSEMIFKVGKRHLSLYATPHGGIMLGVKAKRTIADLNQDGGSLYVSFSMEVENEFIGENSFEVRVSSPKQAATPPCPAN